MLFKKLFTRETKIGIMVIISGAVLFWGFNYLKGVNLFKPTNYYYAAYDSLNGLVETSPVYIKGYKIGQVSKVRSDFTRDKSFVIVLDIDKKITLPKGTVAELFANGLMGGTAVQLLFDPQATAYQQRGDTLQSSQAPDLMASLTQGLLPKIEKLAESADSVITALNSLARSPEIKSALGSLESTSENLSQSSAELKVLMKKDVPRIVDNVSNITTDFAAMGSNLRQIDFQKTAGSLDKTVAGLDSMTQKLNSREGTLGMLINDPQLYKNLNHTVGSLDSLFIDIKNNPKDYVHFSLFGRKNKK